MATSNEVDDSGWPPVAPSRLIYCHRLFARVSGQDFGLPVRTGHASNSVAAGDIHFFRYCFRYHGLRSGLRNRRRDDETLMFIILRLIPFLGGVFKPDRDHQDSKADSHNEQDKV